MTTKALSGRQARWAKTLSQFNFMLTYKPGSQNQADPLTCRDQEMDSQMAMKISTQMQTLLQPENLDPRIIADLDLDPLGPDVGLEVHCSQLIYNRHGTPDAELATVNRSNGTHDLIDDLLQANCTSSDLELLRQRATD
ncbi:hypothetical protein V502_05437 [Pseudogymnoascus sp. VKM F-4520 (FW-2644)]|nr:hypothetical protein V502_05437 [Pseudogymnoascus sp. VKM F-4520 (FW-2644)]